MCLSVYFFWSVQTIFEQNKTENQFYWFFFWRLLNCYLFFGLAKKNVYQPLDEMVFVVSAPIIIIIMTLCRYFFPPANFDVLFFSSAASKTKTKQNKNVNTNEWINEPTKKNKKYEKTNHKFHSTVLKKRLLSHWNFRYLHLPSHNIEQQQQKHIWLYRLVNI